MDSTNPALKNAWRSGQRFATVRDLSPADLQRQYDQPAYTPVHERTMTVPAVVQRTLAMLLVVAATGTATWVGLPERLFAPVVLVALLVGLGLALFISFRRVTNPAAILAYSAAEGIVLGAISHLYEQRYGGIVLQAVMLTGGVFFTMLLLYTSRIIRATPRFARIVVGALVGCLLLMVVNLGAALIGGGDGLGLRSGGPLAIGFSIVCIIVAAMTFVLDFDQIERGVAARVPERYSWYAAFGIVVGLVWLYLEILRLLGYARR